MVSENSLSHREVTGLLHATLVDEFTSPINFLDIACGDASVMSRSATTTASICPSRRLSWLLSIWTNYPARLILKTGTFSRR